MSEIERLEEVIERLRQRIEDLSYRVRCLEQDIFEMKYLSSQ